jgi:peptidoglycan hydrolase FlgJ
MAISPISDIVLEVAKAADPASYSAAAGRLSRLAGSAAAVPAMPTSDAPVPESFAETLGNVGTPRPIAPHMPFDPALALVRMQNQDTLAAQAGSPFEKYEAFVLSSFVETMLPKDSEVLYGAGTAGEIWKSMLAEGLGAQLAKVGGIGIADMLSSAVQEEEVATAAAEPDAAPVCS